MPDLVSSTGLIQDPRSDVLWDVQVIIGLRRRLVPVTTAENFFEEMGSLSQNNDMVSFLSEHQVPVAWSGG